MYHCQSYVYTTNYIRVYGTLKNNLMLKRNRKTHQKIWLTGAVQINVGPPTIPLTKGKLGF